LRRSLIKCNELTEDLEKLTFKNSFYSALLARLSLLALDISTELEKWKAVSEAEKNVAIDAQLTDVLQRGAMQELDKSAAQRLS
jgi:hypothetical protein